MKMPRRSGPLAMPSTTSNPKPHKLITAYFMNGKRRVVVTGIGVLTPVGLNVDEFWKNLVAGKSGAAPVTYFDTSAYDTKFACELKGFKAIDYLDRKSAQRMDPFSQYANIAADAAIADAKLSVKD